MGILYGIPAGSRAETDGVRYNIFLLYQVFVLLAARFAKLDRR